MTGINLRAKVSLFFFTLYLFPLKFSIDGGPEVKGSWGDNPIQLPSGRHHVRVHWLFYWFMPVNKAEIVVDVPPGQVVTVDYKYRYFIFMPGKIWVSPPAVAPGTAPVAAVAGGAPAGWQADPSGRFEQRYWDGNAWTEHVSTGGVASSDPPG